MAAQANLKKYARRFWSLGYSRVLMVLAIVLSLIALVAPMWSVTFQGAPGTWHTSNFSWLGVNTDNYRQGAYDGSSYVPYSAPSFDAAVLSSAIQSGYIILVVYVILLVAATLLFSTSFGTRLPRLALLIMGAFITIVALAALFVPVVTVPTAAATGLGDAALASGFWGAQPSLTWGAGLSWWLVLVALILGVLGAFWPFLKGMRQPMVRAPPPREWQVER